MDALNSSTLDCTLTSSCSSSSSASYSSYKKSNITTVVEEEPVKFSLSDEHDPLIVEKKKPPEPIFKKIWEKM